jgi:hypothetical protein
LIPTSGISDADEQERRATSALLAVLAAVREFGRAVTEPLGAPDGPVEAFVEVPFGSGGQRHVADGLIRIRRGTRIWTALVAVRTGGTAIDPAQLERYLGIAQEQDFDAVLTIGNQVPVWPAREPADLDRPPAPARFHYSWGQVLAEAVSHHEQCAATDPGRAWVLGELIGYLEHPRSGALEFEDLGPAWIAIRDAVAGGVPADGTMTDGTLDPGDPAIAEVTGRFEALIQYAALRLGRRLRADVVPVPVPPGPGLSGAGVLTGSIRVPDTIGPVVITADLPAGTVTCHLDVDAPREGTSLARVHWVVRQLRSAPDSTRVEAFTEAARDEEPSAEPGAEAAELLRALREDPSRLAVGPPAELRGFRIALDLPLGTEPGRGRGSVVDSVLTSIDAFVDEVLPGLTGWSAPARLTIDMTSLDVTAVSVSLEPVARIPAPTHPSRREMRLARPLEFGDGPQDGGAPEAGWYQDPGDERQLRWYDGSAWSEATYPVVALA